MVLLFRWSDRLCYYEKRDASYPDDNGVWIATSMEHHSSLQQEFPIMRSIKLLGRGPMGWQVLPLESDEFEESVYRVCQLIRRRDPRIGKIPRQRRLSSQRLNQWGQRGEKKVFKNSLFGFRNQ